MGFWHNPVAQEVAGLLVRSIEITRRGDLTVADHLTEMRGWLTRAGIQATDLHAVRILKGRVTFSAVFQRAIDADCFRRAFGDEDGDPHV